MKISRGINKEQKEKYVKICQRSWGCVPVDVDWAIGTKIYKEIEKQMIYLKEIKENPIIETISKI